MSTLRFKSHFNSWDLQKLGIPIEIRKPNLALVATSLTSQSVDLPPGTYHVTARLPTGTELYNSITLAQGEDATVDLRPDPEDTSPRESWEVQTYLRRKPKRFVETLGPGQPEYPELRFFTGNPLESQLQLKNLSEFPEQPSIQNEGIEEVYVLKTNEPTVVQLLQRGHPPLNTLLPGDPRDQYRFSIVHPSERRYSIDVRLWNVPADALLRYLEHGMLTQADEIISTRTPEVISEDLLYEKVNDPIGATVGAYSILRLGALERLHNWTKNLCNWFRWLPDGVVIRAEHLARLGNHEEAMKTFLGELSPDAPGLSQRGLPFFSDGLSYAYNRLRQYSTLEEKEYENHFTTAQVRDAHALLKKLEPFVNYTNFREPVLSFSGLDPNQPDDQVWSGMVLQY